MTAPAADSLAIESADDARIRALVNADFAALERALADELVYVHSNAFVDSKRSYLDGLRAGHVRFLGVSREHTRVRLVGGVALLDCSAVLRFEIKGRARDARSRVMSAWVLRDGRWQMAHYHSTSLPAESV
ncbi:nuclear transport factor 2 family protein [Hydrogenophaga sp.]|uniref:nuclear transport factor 2 family protein n=1 Tax=Hydrogenophaga sp. TaxID=1904254 RepID=UPI0027273B08|nr:nuclear transport factor 2 family protein [Hydrogenophaga sp.]MDO9437660.1 nuclear transport factor 2 family protein [Hydrogenophaga sp.]